MKLKQRLGLFAFLIALTILAGALVTVIGLRSLQNASDRADQHRDFLQRATEIKASALSTILLDAKDADTQKIFQAADQNIQKNAEFLLLMLKDQDDKALFGTLKQAWERYYDASNKIVSESASLSAEATTDKVKALYTSAFLPMSAQVEKFSNALRLGTEEEVARFNGLKYFVFIGILGAFSLVFLLALLNTGMLSRSLLKSLGGDPMDANAITHAIAAGDLSHPVPLKTGDTSSVMAGLSQMQATLRTLIGEIQNASDRIYGAANQLAVSAKQVSEHAEKQSESAESMAAAVEEVAVSVAHVAENSEATNQSAADAGAKSMQGRTLFGHLEEEITQMARAMKDSSHAMDALNEHSERIFSIVEVIREIADQTNLLALNAAIEAARAGESGRGFAVVADEVRKLAEKTSISTGEITSMVQAIQASIKDAVKGIESGNARIEESVAMTHEASNSLVNIEQSTKEVESSVSDITGAMKEQKAASEQIAQGIEHVAQMAEESISTVKEVSATSSALAALSNQLKEQVGRFHL